MSGSLLPRDRDGSGRDWGDSWQGERGVGAGGAGEAEGYGRGRECELPRSAALPSGCVCACVRGTRSGGERTRLVLKTEERFGVVLKREGAGCKYETSRGRQSRCQEPSKCRSRIKEKPRHI